MKPETVFTASELQWLVNHSRILKDIIAGKGRVALDMKVQIEIYNRRQEILDAKAKRDDN